MIPIRDNIPSRSFPFVNNAIILICVVAFLLQLANSEQGALVDSYGMVPARLMHPGEVIETIQQVPVQTPYGIQVREVVRQTSPAAIPEWLTLFTCMFLHGGWMHMLGNMWFLYIFGDNVEDCFGHVGYLLFYVGCGLLAGITHLLTGPDSAIPTIGASGAIAGIMGSYLILYPRAMVLAIIPIGFFLQTFVIPAAVFLGFWFLLQFFQGTMAISSAQSGGVAWWAHIGGFAAGLVVTFVLEKLHWIRAPVHETLPDTDHISSYRGFPTHRVRG